MAHHMAAAAEAHGLGAVVLTCMHEKHPAHLDAAGQVLVLKLRVCNHPGSPSRGMCLGHSLDVILGRLAIPSKQWPCMRNCHEELSWHLHQPRAMERMLPELSCSMRATSSADCTMRGQLWKGRCMRRLLGGTADHMLDPCIPGQKQKLSASTTSRYWTVSGPPST